MIDFLGYNCVLVGVAFLLLAAAEDMKARRISHDDYMEENPHESLWSVFLNDLKDKTSRNAAPYTFKKRVYFAMAAACIVVGAWLLGWLN